jgi:hypothetical protein
MHLNGSTGVLEECNIGSAWGKGHKVNFGILTVSLNRVFFYLLLNLSRPFCEAKWE